MLLILFWNRKKNMRVFFENFPHLNDKWSIEHQSRVDSSNLRVLIPVTKAEDLFEEQLIFFP